MLAGWLKASYKMTSLIEPVSSAKRLTTVAPSNFPTHNGQQLCKLWQQYSRHCASFHSLALRTVSPSVQQQSVSKLKGNHPLGVERHLMSGRWRCFANSNTKSNHEDTVLLALIQGSHRLLVNVSINLPISAHCPPSQEEPQALKQWPRMQVPQARHHKINHL